MIGSPRLARLGDSACPRCGFDVGAGRKSNIRPADLVGAIVNEAGVDPRAIGAIQITDRFSLVEVPDEIADEIISTLRAATIKGKRVPVRRDREQGGGSE